MAEESETTIKLKWPWFVAGAIYGVFLRFLFDILPSSIDGPMSLAFLVGTPLIVGALTIYGYRKQRVTILQMLFLPWVTSLLMLLGTAIALLEGSICIAIMTPLFLLCSSLGGLLMGGCLYLVKRNTKPLLSIAFLPYLIFFSEGKLPLDGRQLHIEESIIVDARAERVWNEIITAKQIHSKELPLSVSHLIGVPKPLEGINLRIGDSEIRFSTWEKGVNFKALIQKREEYKYIKWKYIFDEHSFPKGSMDDHIAIGGRYFDLQDTSFTLSSVDTEKTKLTIRASYRINSAINFYAVPASKFLGIDFVRTILELYRNRSEQTPD